jgi:conjugal transfer pilus assembly protein TraW
MADDPVLDRRARLMAACQGAVVAVLIAAAFAIAASAQGLAARSSAIGRTWPIAEPDALSEIEAKVATMPRDMSKAFGPRSSWSALKAATLASAQTDRVRSVVPFYTLEFDIRLPEGKTLYPRGYTFNPLAYVRLPQRLVVVHPRDLAWAVRTARASDFILLTALSGESADPIALGERAGRAIYILEERVKERLGLTVAPVIVAQAGQKLVLTEFGPKSRSAAKGGAL